MQTEKLSYKYLYARTYSDVKAKLIKAQSSIEFKSETGKHKDEEKYEFWLTEWLRAKRIRIKDSTYIRYRNLISNHILPELGKYPINKIGTPLLESFVSNKLKCGRLDGNGGLSPKTMLDMMTVIKESFKYAQAAGVLTICRFDGISFKHSSQEMRVLSVFEQEQLLSILFENFDRYKMGVFICLYTGIRIGELCALQWKDISFSEKVIVIEHTMQRLQNDDPNALYKTKIIVTEPKSKASVRTIPLPDFVINAIKPFLGSPNADDMVVAMPFVDVGCDDILVLALEPFVGKLLADLMSDFRRDFAYIERLNEVSGNDFGDLRTLLCREISCPFKFLRRRIACSTSVGRNIEGIVCLLRVKNIGESFVYSSSDWLDFSNCHISPCLSFSSATSSA